MSLRKAINNKCRQCTHDSLDPGTAAQQIACCVASDCPLHPVRPITTTIIPIRLLEAHRINAEQLCERARELVQLEPIAPDAGQNGPLLGIELVSERESLLRIKLFHRAGNETP
ncbi:MAG: hypothetical protein P8L39_09260 [Halioglobus sp.]|nr:hypothetical protein [Halioglobus sp.]